MGMGLLSGFLKMGEDLFPNPAYPEGNVGVLEYWNAGVRGLGLDTLDSTLQHSIGIILSFF